MSRRPVPAPVHEDWAKRRAHAPVPAGERQKYCSRLHCAPPQIATAPDPESPHATRSVPPDSSLVIGVRSSKRHKISLEQLGHDERSRQDAQLKKPRGRKKAPLKMYGSVVALYSVHTLHETHSIAIIIFIHVLIASSTDPRLLTNECSAVLPLH